MGIQCCSGQRVIQHNNVTQLPAQLPNDKRYLFFRGKTNRYNDLSVMHIDSNVYVFNLKTDRHKQIQVKLTVLNEIAHRVVHANYKLKISNNIVMDPMDESYQNTLILVKNPSTGLEYHMRVIPFIGYNSGQFKKALEQIWICQNKISKNDKHLFLTLQQTFIYGVNSDQQAVVLLFQKIDGDLFHIGEYRRLANWFWTEAQKIKIIQNLFQSIIKLKELNIVHRNISLSNIFLKQKLNRFVLGNFSSSRQLFYSDDSDLITVYGSQSLSQDRLAQLIHKKSDMGIFNMNKAIYTSIKMVILYIESLSITNKKPNFTSNVLQTILNKLNQYNSFEDILGYLAKVDLQTQYRKINLSEDKIIAKMVEPLLLQKNRKKAKEYQFQTYQLLGYYTQFSDMSHKMIEINNKEDKAYKNAYIFKDLGYFYEKNGTGGLEYLLNACILFCKQTQKYIQYKLYTKAAENLNQAEELYIKLSNISDFSLNLIQINRLRSLIKIYNFDNMDQINEKNEANQLINKTMSLASQKNLPIEKQMKLLLTLGIINRQIKNINLAQEKFRNGLSICQNTGAFQNLSSSLLTKSNFLYQLGILYLQKMEQMHNPQRSSMSQSYISHGYRQKCEQNLKYSLEIRQKEEINPFHIAQCHSALGWYYLLLNNFVQAKSEYKKCLLKMKLLKEDLSPEITVKANYDLGSAHYKLKEYDQAQFYYKQAIHILEQTQYDNDWKFTIQGNLAFAKICSGQKMQGFQQLQKVKQIIKNKQGPDSYDYLFLVTQESKVVQDMY